MKKIFVALMSIFLVCGVASAELTKDQKKQVKKEVSNKMKEFKKENWKIFGSTNTLEGALTAHITAKTEMGADGHEVVGLADNFKSKNLGKQQATHSACVQYAQESGSSLKGQVESKLGGNGSSTTGGGEFDVFYAAFERSLQHTIQNELRESFSIIKELPGGTYDMQTFYLVNEEAATRARVRAVEDAVKESKLPEKQATSITIMVREEYDKISR